MNGNGKVLYAVPIDGCGVPIFGIGVINEDMGICLKIDDGSYRAIDPIIIDVLHSLDLINKDEFQQLKSLWKPSLMNHRGEFISELHPVFKLNRF